MSATTETRCGTYAEYQRHKKRGEAPCAACRRAAADYQAEWRANKANRDEEKRRLRARERALSRLQAMHPALYRALYMEELGA